jgi:transcriptional regulator with XRE-family HTH domain
VRDDLSIHELDMLVAAALRRHRRQAHLSAAELGERIGVTETRIREYEAGRVELEAYALWRLSKALDVPLDTFFEDPDQPRAPGAGKRRSLGRKLA